MTIGSQSTAKELGLTYSTEGFKTLTPVQLDGVRFVLLMAEAARKDLGQNASKGSNGRPTVAQLNRTMDRLTGIIDTIEKVVLA